MANLFIPANPTLWPSMLLGALLPGTTAHSGSLAFAHSPGTAPARTGAPAALPFPFSLPTTRYFYFARNAIYLLVQMLGLAGGEVLVPDYHHGVEIEALVAAGALLQFYRVGRRWDVDLDDMERKITPRTRALYLTHYAGMPGPAKAVREMAQRHGLFMIEDCALSLLSKRGEKPLGTAGDAAVFCLYKTLPVPNGGAMVLRQGLEAGSRAGAAPGLARPPRTSTFSHVASSLLQNVEMRGGTSGKAIRAAVRLAGRKAVRATRVERVTTGSDHFNPDDAHLAMSDLSLKIVHRLKMQEIAATRRRNYEYYLANLGDAARPLFDRLPEGTCPLFYPLVVEKREKDEVIARLEAEGVEAIDLWRTFHPLCDPAGAPDAAWLRRSIVEIPCHQDVTPQMAEKVVAAVKRAM